MSDTDIHCALKTAALIGNIVKTNASISGAECGCISFDVVVQTMYETGKDMSRHYRETSEGGLAKLYK